jgi:hypothetical protein
MNEPRRRSAAFRLKQAIKDFDREGDAPEWPTPAVAKAFEALDLDPHSHDDCRRLLSIFADVHFGTNGRPKTRPWVLWATLGAYHRARSKWPEHSGSDSKLCELMVKNSKKLFEGRFNNIKPDALRKRVEQARNLDGGMWDRYWASTWK